MKPVESQQRLADELHSLVASLEATRDALVEMSLCLKDLVFEIDLKTRKEVEEKVNRLLEREKLKD
jgi:hypothetical protein